AVTNHLSQNVAAIPFLWVLPLSIYLLTFILCFDGRGWYDRKWYLWVLAPTLLGTMTALIKLPANASLRVLVPGYIISLFVCCMFCHGELAASKPVSRHLTSFYLMISLGGALGAVF